MFNLRIAFNSGLAFACAITSASAAHRGRGGAVSHFAPAGYHDVTKHRVGHLGVIVQRTVTRTSYAPHVPVQIFPVAQNYGVVHRAPAAHGQFKHHSAYFFHRRDGGYGTFISARGDGACAALRREWQSTGAARWHYEYVACMSGYSASN